jgi:short-subunit dehydrogenase
MRGLRGKVRHAVVVGASSGVGLRIADALVGEGVVLSTVGRKPSPHARAWHHACNDLGAVDWDEAYRAAERHASTPIDAVVYVAGSAAFGQSRAIPKGRARALFEDNMWSPAAAALAAERLWEIPRRGTFAAVSTISARRAVPFEAYYCASKAAGARFLEALELEHPDGRLRFVSVFPGRLRTPFRAKADWYGRDPDPAPTEGSDPSIVARALLAVLAGGRGGRVLGARERAIDLADRVSPRLYDRLVLRPRVRRALRPRDP